MIITKCSVTVVESTLESNCVHCMLKKKKKKKEYITKKKNNKVLLTRPFGNSPCQSPLQEFPLPFLLT